MNEKHTIWQDPVYEDEKDYTEAYADYKAMRDEEGLEAEDIQEFINDLLNDYLDDERANLNIEVPNGILKFGAFGKWDGLKPCYAKQDKTNIADCLRSDVGGYCKFYVEDGDFHMEESHHDGTNHFIFRAWKDGVTEDEKDQVRYACYCASDYLHPLIEKYTESLAPMIAKVYGW